MSDQGSLQEQFDLYERQSERVEEWKLRHLEAMFCRDVEDAVGIGLTILDNINRRNNAWCRAVEHQASQCSWESVHTQAEKFRWWLEKSRRVLQGVEICERSNFQVQNADKFRQAILNVSLMSLDVDRACHAIESLESGRGIPAKQAMDELRNRLRRSGS